MWRRSSLPGKKTTDDSDESIEEEEDEDVAAILRANDTRPKKRTSYDDDDDDDDLVVLDSPEESYVSSSSSKIVGLSAHQCMPPDDKLEKRTSYDDEDLVIPDSPEESYLSSAKIVGLSAPPDDKIPHDEQAEMWANVNKETKSLIQLNDTASVLRTKRNGCKAFKDHVKPKFSLRNMADVLHPDDDDPITEFHDDFDEKSENKQSTYAAKEVVPKPLDKTRVIKRSSKPYTRRGAKGLKSSNKNSSSKLQDNETDDELPGPDDSESSSHDDDKPTHHQSSEPKRKDFIDVFYEAIQASSLGEEVLFSGSPQISSGSNMYGRLQQIIKHEKVTDYKIMRKLRGQIRQTDPSSYLDVKIMSRNLEGKLVVCKCFINDLSGVFFSLEDSLLLKNTQACAGKEEETTIIFNPKVCVNAYIEIGSIVRLHAPWKEIQVKNTSELIILCSYFSNL